MNWTNTECISFLVVITVIVVLLGVIELLHTATHQGGRRDD